MRRFDTFPEPDLCNLIDFADEVVLATQAGPPRLKNRSRLSSEEAVPLITFHTPFRSIIRIKGDHPMDTFFELAIDVLPDEKSAQQLFLGFNPIEPQSFLLLLNRQHSSRYHLAMGPSSVEPLKGLRSFAKPMCSNS